MIKRGENQSLKTRFGLVKGITAGTSVSRVETAPRARKIRGRLSGNLERRLWMCSQRGGGAGKNRETKNKNHGKVAMKRVSKRGKKWGSFKAA